MNILLESVSFTYPGGVVALRDVSLSIAPGEAVAILGENGAGKTTLARHLNGSLQPGRGRVTVGDWDTRRRSVAQMARRVGYAFQNPDEQLFAQSVEAEVAFGPRNLGASDDEVRARVRDALEQVGLVGAAGGHPYDLQPAQRKLVALAAVLAMRTPVVVLDEPTTGQDARGLALLGAVVARLKAEGRTVLAISHDVDFCFDHFERAVVLSRGAVLADGPAAAVLADGERLSYAAVEPAQFALLATILGLPAAPRTVEECVDALAACKGAAG